MSKKESYLGGHSVFTIKKKNKSKVTTGTIIKSKRNWPYKTIKPDAINIDLSSNEKSILKKYKDLLAINERRIKKILNKSSPDQKLLEKLLNEKSNIEKLLKKTLENKKIKIS